MAETMIERVARVLCARRAALHLRTTTTDPLVLRLVDKDWELFESDAYAMIKAMREPTDDMLAAAHRNNHPRDRDTWTTMIDQALKGKER